MEWISGNIFIRPNNLNKVGEFVDGHGHNFDHTTIIFKGAVEVRAKLPTGQIVERTFTAPAHFLVKAEVEHKITAVEDNTVFWCVYSHRTPQGDIIQEYDGWDLATV